MASRRSRIKGIANIPQRRKPENEKFKEESDELNTAVKCEVNDDNITISKNEMSKSISEDKQLHNTLEEPPDSNNISPAIPSTTDHVETIEENSIREELPVIKATPASNKPPAFKRKFLKAPVSLNALQKRKKIEEVKTDKLVPEKRQETDNSEIPRKAIDNCIDIELETSVNESEIRSDDVSTVSLSENIENVFQKPSLLINNTTNSDTEYPLPPPSPNKTNRTRIKAIPRLAHRKTSFSASESEDESRKINRNRNDSVCSTTSVVADSITECFSPQRPKETITFPQPKKSVARLEPSRRLAEGRKEFLRRFGFKKPERHRLTMMDLIFYNPDTNPMVNEDDTKENDTINDADDPVNAEENVDDPIDADGTKSDEENDIPVPQIKIGPSGEIILDEQSLVIERKEVQKKREEMEKSKVVDADKIKTSYGIYKKHKRTKFWTTTETIYFYRALNTLGTDFTLMCELFPNRTRRELKIKFKKEEKMNRTLIDKALMEPCNFDFDDLKNEIELEERELEAIKKHQKEEKKLKEEIAKENQRIAMEKIQKRKAEVNASKTYIPKPKAIPRDTDLGISKTVGTKPIVRERTKKDNSLKPKTSKRPKKQKLSIKTYMSDSDADESDIATQSESDEDVVLSNKPTRSGRVPKATKRYDNEFSSISSLMKRNKIPDEDRPDNIEPGSIMVITENGPNGEPIYKLYMVTPEQKATPLDVPSDTVEAIQLRKGMTAKSIMTISANVTDDEEIPPENNITISEDENITIPADENITSLRTIVNNEERKDGDREGNVRINKETKFVDENDEDNDTVIKDAILVKTDDNIETVKIISDLEEDCVEKTDNAQVIATDSHSVILNRDNFVFVNKNVVIGENVPLDPEINNDGLCKKLENESDRLRTGVSDNTEVCKFT